jgi:fatty acid-binding protein DegV
MEPQVCILTDPTVQFLSHDFSGVDLVFVLTANNQAGFMPAAETLKPAYHLLKRTEDRLIRSEHIQQALYILSRHYKEIILLLPCDQIDRETNTMVQLVLAGLQGRIAVQVFRASTFASGLGYLAERGASVAANGASGVDVLRQIQHSMLHVYTILCTKDLRPLSEHGGMDRSHAMIGEMLGIAPVMIVENNQLLPFQKVKTARNLADTYMEYLEEFYKLKRIAIHKSTPLFGGEMNQLRERITAGFPDITLHEFFSSPRIVRLLGQRSISMIVIEE